MLPFADYPIVLEASEGRTFMGCTVDACGFVGKVQVVWGVGY